MKIKRMDVTIQTERLKECKEFYIKHFNFKLVYESDWYVELLSPDLQAGISFILPQREADEFFNGQGLVVSFEVADVDAEYVRLKQAGLAICQELQDKPWGERSFVVDDPAKVHVYVYTSIPPTQEYQQMYSWFNDGQ